MWTVVQGGSGNGHRLSSQVAVKCYHPVNGRSNQATKNYYQPHVNVAYQRHIGHEINSISYQRRLPITNI